MRKLLLGMLSMGFLLTVGQTITVSYDKSGNVVSRLAGLRLVRDSVFVRMPNLWRDVVKHYRGATYVVREKANKSKGVTLGSFINIWDEHSLPRNAEGKLSFGDDVVGRNSKYMYMHEYGHYLQSQKYGPVWLLSHGVPSLVSAMKSRHNDDYNHNEYWTERDANWKAIGYFYEFEGLGSWWFKQYPVFKSK